MPRRRMGRTPVHNHRTIQLQPSHGGRTKKQNSGGDRACGVQDDDSASSCWKTERRRVSPIQGCLPVEPHLGLDVARTWQAHQEATLVSPGGHTRFARVHHLMRKQGLDVYFSSALGKTSMHPRFKMPCPGRGRPSRNDSRSVSHIV